MSSPDPFAPARLRTDDIPERIRMEIVRDYYGRILMALDIAPDPDDRFMIDVAAVALPGVHVGSGGSSALVSSRTTGLLADGNDDVDITCVLDDFRLSTPRGGDLDFKGGEVAAFTMAQEIAIRLPPQARFRTVQVSRALLGPLLPDVDNLSLNRIDPNRPEVQLLFGYAKVMEAAPPRDLEARNLAARQLAELAALVLGNSRDMRDLAEGQSVRAARRASLKAMIRTHLDDPDLSVARVAARLGISVRYVHQLFEEEGLTFSAYVNRLRLEQVRTMLDDPRHLRRRIAELAFEVGFRDLSTFNRQFRRQFGETPTALRARR